MTRLTYREGWKRHVLPHLKADAGDGPPEAPAPPTQAQKAFIDQLCGGKVYDGERWWEPVLEQTKAREEAKRQEMERERMKRQRGT